MRRQPQLLVRPPIRLVAKVVVVLPQSHMHSHRNPQAELPTMRIAVSILNLEFHRFF